MAFWKDDTVEEEHHNIRLFLISLNSKKKMCPSYLAIKGNNKKGKEKNLII